MTCTGGQDVEWSYRLRYDNCDEDGDHERPVTDTCREELVSDVFC